MRRLRVIGWRMDELDGGAESAANGEGGRIVVVVADGLWRRTKIQRRHDMKRREDRREEVV